jgi:hypothetical protein
VLVPDLAHEFLQDVLDGHQAGRPAELIDHDRDVHLGLLEVPKLLLDGL